MKKEPRVMRRPEDSKVEPALPHEQDQKAGSQQRAQTEDRNRLRKGFEDAESGKVDTGPQPVIEETDRKLRGSADH
ncbi:hypothetical protein [Derxia lacustris]|uniref:hypothetical protein n=1 Tax=Derxia lacustris TaxID=764842 RepID=UPI00111C5651|nr:hypothetical protein [Derxia lacustris]